VLDFTYDEKTNTLTATAGDFLLIRNEALGYQVKYLVKNFLFDSKKVYYQGPVMFEELSGSASDEQLWKSNREAAFQNSPMHFLRSVISDRLNEEGFAVQQYAIYANPGRPADGVIKNKIALYNQAGANADSLSYWVKKSKLPKTFSKLMPYALTAREIARPAGSPGMYALNCDNDGLYVTYNKKHHFHLTGHLSDFLHDNYTENTLLDFNKPEAAFNSDGVIQNPYDLTFYGAWGRSRVADLLPINYDPGQRGATQSALIWSENIAARLDSFMVRHPVEKAYLQFDKPYYAAGDTIYFKAYVTFGENHKLSDLSGVLHVDLINTKNKIDKSIQLQLDTGLAWGDFALPDSLPQGNYRVRAYTQWMRNAPDPVFFEKTITVAALKPVRIPGATVRRDKQEARPDVQFFPEGGSLITGLPVKIAFKAIGLDGLGMDFKGIVTDDLGAQVLHFASEHLGMGYFYLTPLAGRSYAANVSYPDSRQDIIKLPNPTDEGIALAVDNDSLPKATIKIISSPGYFKDNKGKGYNLVISSGGVIASVNCPLDSQVIKVDVLKRRLHTGVATVTLFSPENEPLSERLFFIQNYDRLRLDLSADKQTYSQREKVSMKLNALDRREKGAGGHFSVSVIDESKAPDMDSAAENILSGLLLTSDLKGFVERPGYYFSDTAAHISNDLDVLLLTQGYRRFEWKQVLDSANRPIVYQPEKGINISGLVTGLFDKPVVNGTVTLLPLSGGQLLSTTTGTNGNFRFADLLFADSAHFVLSAVNAGNKNSTQIKLISDAAPLLSGPLRTTRVVSDSIVVAYVSNDKTYQQATASYLLSKGIMLKQVNIRDRKPDNQYRTLSLAGAGNADQVLHSKDLLGGQLSTSLYLLRGITPVTIGFSVIPYLHIELLTAGPRKPTPMLVVVDGVTQDRYFDINNIPTSIVETIEVLKSGNASIYGIQGGAGVLVITTKQSIGIDPKDIPAKGVLPVSPAGFYKARQFYSPKYDHPDLQNKWPDLRSTIYWQPELKTDANGNAVFEYYNADGKGTYKVTIEGIDKNGNIGRAVYRYKVQ
jgi:hypothetical protein